MCTHFVGGTDISRILHYLLKAAGKAEMVSQRCDCELIEFMLSAGYSDGGRHASSQSW